MIDTSDWTDRDIRDALVEVDNCDDELNDWEMGFVEENMRGSGTLTPAQREKAEQIINKYLKEE